MPSDKELLQIIKSQRVGTHKQVRRKAQQVVLLTSKEEQEKEEDTKEEDTEEEKYKEHIQVKKTIQVGEKQIPIGSTPSP